MEQDRLRAQFVNEVCKILGDSVRRAANKLSSDAYTNEKYQRSKDDLTSNYETNRSCGTYGSNGSMAGGPSVASVVETFKNTSVRYASLRSPFSLFFCLLSPSLPLHL